MISEEAERSKQTNRKNNNTSGTKLSQLDQDPGGS